MQIQHKDYQHKPRSVWQEENHPWTSSSVFADLWVTSAVSQQTRLDERSPGSLTSPTWQAFLRLFDREANVGVTDGN